MFSLSVYQIYSCECCWTRYRLNWPCALSNFIRQFNCGSISYFQLLSSITSLDNIRCGKRFYELSFENWKNLWTWRWQDKFQMFIMLLYKELGWTINVHGQHYELFPKNIFKRKTNFFQMFWMWKFVGHLIQTWL